MGKLTELGRRLLCLLRRERFDRDLRDEIQFHIDMKIEENLAAGMPPKEARRDALRRFGNVTLTREVSRDMWGFRWLEILGRDLKYGLRMLIKNPSFTAVAVLSLGLGIGGCTAIFSIVDAVLLRSLPFREPDRLVQFREVSSKGTQMAVAEPNYLDLRAHNRSLESLAQYSGDLSTVLGGTQPVRTRVLWATSEFFRVLGAEPFAGRAFMPEESQAADRAVAVVSYGFWQRVLAGKPDFNGTVLRISNRSYEVIGVMPPGFNFPQGTDIWTPREVFPAQTSRSAHNWRVIARLRQDLSFEQAREDVSALGKRLIAQYGGNDMDAVDFALVPLQEYMVGSVRQGLLIILAAVGFLLLVACTNVANLLLAQVTARQKELAVRAALGGSRLRLARQFITENVLLTLTAGALGVLISIWGVGFLVNLNRAALPRADEIGLDVRVLLFSLGLSLLVAVVLGLIPVLRLSDYHLTDDLKEAGRGSSEHAGGKGLRSLLVVAQIAFTLVLLVGAGLLIKSFIRLIQIDPGFRTESTVVMDLSLPQSKDDPRRYELLMQFFKQIREGRTDLPQSLGEDPEQKRTALFYQQLIERISQIEGVTAVGAINKLPMTGSGGDGTFWIENNNALTGNAEYRQASQGYFAVMGIPLLRGRMFEPTDTPDSQHVAVISQSLAQAVWPDTDPIGKRIQFGNMDSEIKMLEIVGIVGDVREYGLESGIRHMVYVSPIQRPQWTTISVVVRAGADTGALFPAMRQAVQSLNAEIPVSFRTLEQIFSSSFDNRRFSLVIFVVFAAVALVLAAVGLYGVMSYSVTQRTHEIGVRMALGAERRDVMRLIVGQGLKLTVVGVAVGFGAAFALARLMSSLLYSVSTSDPATFAITSVMLTAVALLACYVPGRRAMKIDPMTALRYE
jgi:putative ABC transport system permease protein